MITPENQVQADTNNREEISSVCKPSDKIDEYYLKPVRPSNVTDYNTVFSESNDFNGSYIDTTHKEITVQNQLSHETDHSPNRQVKN